MNLPPIHVVSTGWKHATRNVCEMSVRSQLDVELSHTYVEASEQDPPRTKIENLREIIGRMAPDAVVALVDGDDWLAHRRALARVAREHAAGMWVTYGSFVNSDGTPGFAGLYDPDEDYRRVSWRATHLKTFRAGLFQAIRDIDLKYPSNDAGEVVLSGPSTCMRWIDRGDDPAFMFPILEMAGRDRTVWVRDVLYVYNEPGSWHRTASPEELEHQRRIMLLTRGRPRYARLPNLGEAPTVEGV